MTIEWMPNDWMPSLGPVPIVYVPLIEISPDATACAQMDFEAWDILSDEALANLEQGLD